MLKNSKDRARYNAGIVERVRVIVAAERLPAQVNADALIMECVAELALEEQV